MRTFSKKLEEAPLALTFGDALLLPGFSEVEPKDINVRTRATINIDLALPLISSPMDTVTESDLAIALAKEGGLGIIHRNFSAEEEVRMVKAVKEAEVKLEEFPNASIDQKGRLLCGAAVSPYDAKRAKSLDDIADVIVIDVAHFHTKKVFEATKKLMKELSSDIVIGNIGTYEAAEDALTTFDRISAFRVGIGSGSICLTSTITRSGSPTIFATAQVADAVRDYGADIPIIADGGIRCGGDIAVALACGASSAMIGNLFARCEEAPGRISIIRGKKYKEYRGMASLSAMKRRFMLDRYGLPSKKVVEGAEGWVPYEGRLSEVVERLIAELKAAMGYAGAKDIRFLQEKSRIAILTPIGIREVEPHDLICRS